MCILNHYGMQCQICFQIIEGKTRAKLTNHIANLHNLSLEDYIVQIEYDGNAPKCACGLCEEKPFFNRGKFSEYALGHNEFKTREALYIEKYGLPKCLHCGNEVNFHRGSPRQYCSVTCAGLHNGGFTQSNIQNKIKEIVLERYGVENVSHILAVQKKISIQQYGENNSFYGSKHNDVVLQKISDASKMAWQNNDIRRSSFKKIMHDVRKKNWQDPVYRKTILQGNLNGKHSKLHRKISEELGLKKMGFESEKVIFRYRVDEVNFEKKIIVEINGDYIHANPNKYNADDLIIVRKSQYLAKDKWQYDLKRKEALEALGFKVFVVWQSDNLDDKKKEFIKIYDNKI